MTDSAKSSLQDVVGTICDALTDLSTADQARALEAVRLTLGLSEPSTSIPRPSWGTPVPPSEAFTALALPTARLPSPLPQQQEAPELEPLPALLQEKPVLRLPTVVVQMMGDRPMVVGQQVGRPGRIPAVVAPPRRQLSAPTETQATACRGGYVLPRRRY